MATALPQPAETLGHTARNCILQSTSHNNSFSTQKRARYCNVRSIYTVMDTFV